MADREALLRELRKVNTWWTTGRLELPGLVKRECFERAYRELGPGRALQINGPRRAGKTVVLRQMIAALIDKGVPPKNILYFSLDDPSVPLSSDTSLGDMLDLWLEEVAGPGERYAFFDEAHALPGWHTWLKSFVDRRPEIRFAFSGSSSLAIQAEASRYLRGRTVELSVLPLTFREFLQFKGENPPKYRFEQLFGLDRLEVAALCERYRNHLLEYLLVGGYPEWFRVGDVASWFDRMVSDIPKKAIYEDVVNLFDIRSPRTLENILAFLAENQSRILSYEKINEVAGLHRSILLNYIEYLKTAFLVIEVPKLARSVREQAKSMKKFLILDQGVRNALVKERELGPEGMGFAIENAVGIGARRHGELFYFRVDGEVDFVLRRRGELIPIEVKYSDAPNVRPEFFKFIGRHGPSFAIVVTREHFRNEKAGKTAVHYLPVSLFLLAEP